MQIPTHIGIILDGNRRWAKARGLAIIDGHREGARNLKRIALHAFDQGVKFVTVYAFSNENWNRPQAQVRGLMQVFREIIARVEKEYKKEGVVLRFIGRFDRFPDVIKTQIPAIEEKTKNGKRGTLIIALGYGGRQEIIDVIRKIVAQRILPDRIHEDAVRQNLYAPDIPDPDLIIRTGGQRRLSGFLTWQSIYSELFFTNTLWPDLTTTEIDAIIKEFVKRQRNFGK